jgi:hypothetical protein
MARSPVISQAHRGGLEKRLGTSLMSGEPSSTSTTAPHLESDFLCQALTQQRLKIRILGHSQQVETPINADLPPATTGIANDLVRRSLPAR